MSGLIWSTPCGSAEMTRDSFCWRGFFRTFPFFPLIAVAEMVNPGSTVLYSALIAASSFFTAAAAASHFVAGR